MSDAGYVRIYRSLLGHPAFRNDAEALAFAWMVIRAQWRPTRVRYKDRIIQLHRGQLAISVRDMANALDRDKAWVERLWKRLKSETMLETASATGVSVVTICNYDDYQGDRDTDEAVRETPRETDARQARDTEQRREKGKKVIEEETDVSSSRQPDDCDAVVSSWNAMATSTDLPTCQKLSDKRRKACRARLRDDGLDAIQRAIARIPHSAFLRGDTGNWAGASFDFLLRPDSVTSILEGKYDDRDRSVPPPSGSQGRSRKDGAAAALDRRLGLDEPSGSSGRRDAGPSSGYCGRALVAPGTLF